MEIQKYTILNRIQLWPVWLWLDTIIWYHDTMGVTVATDTGLGPGPGMNPSCEVKIHRPVKIILILPLQIINVCCGGFCFWCLAEKMPLLTKHLHFSALWKVLKLKMLLCSIGNLLRRELFTELICKRTIGQKLHCYNYVSGKR